MTKADTIGISKNRALTYAVIIALVGGALFLERYFSLVAVALITAFIFNPVYLYLYRKFNNPGAASALTLIISLLAIVVPVIIIIYITAQQASTIVSDIGSYFNGQNFNQSQQNLLNWINNFLSNLSGKEVSITQQEITDWLRGFASDAASFVLNTITSWVGSLGSLITNAILFMYVFTAVLVHQKKLTELFGNLNPLGTEISDLYLKKTGDMTKGMVKGQFIIAALQGTASALILGITGMPYIAFFALILSFMSLIPLGAGIVTIPIGIVRILMGDVWQGVVIILGHLLIITNIDNFLKPVLVPKSVKLQPALTLLSVFGGLAAFGFLGIVIGPVIMILIVTTIDLYLRQVKKSNR